MKNDTAIDILRIATTLASSALANNTHTASYKNGAAVKVEAVFADCVKLAEKYYQELTGSE